MLEKRLARFKSVFRAEFISAMASARLEKADDAERHFLAAEERARAEQPHLLDHRFYFQFGATMERLGKIEIATRQLLLALEKKPDFDEALNHLGYMWADRGENLERAHEMIRKAVENLFNVKVDSVNTLLMRGKDRRMGGGYGKMQNWKKAIITLREGSSIDFFDASES